MDLLVYKAVFVANVLIAGAVGSFALFSPDKAKSLVFQNAFQESEAIRITGAFWLAIAILSAFGIFYPLKFVLIFWIQFIYKGLWLAVGALPKIIQKRFSEIPLGMALFFLVYVLFLPLILRGSI
jgi:hypothetical protein